MILHVSQRFQNEFTKTNFLGYYRTKEEISAPFAYASTPVYKSGLRLITIEFRTIECPYHNRWMTEGKDGMM